MPVVVSSYHRPRAQNPYVRRRWRLVAFLAVAAVLSWGLALALLSGGVTVDPPNTARMPFASPVAAGLLLACIAALPLSLATYLTLGSFQHADDAVTIAGFSLGVTALLCATFGGDFLWLANVSILVGTGLVRVGILGLNASAAYDSPSHTTRLAPGHLAQGRRTAT